MDSDERRDEEMDGKEQRDVEVRRDHRQMDRTEGMYSE
jgi:hypothetical protein